MGQAKGVQFHTVMAKLLLQTFAEGKRTRVVLQCNGGTRFCCNPATHKLLQVPASLGVRYS